MFLLSLRAGSAGLTLTAATRVFLLEPAMDPAIEQQAVARVHRIGQEKEVVITRLLMVDTVEEEVGFHGLQGLGFALGNRVVGFRVVEGLGAPNKESRQL